MPFGAQIEEPTDPIFAWLDKRCVLLVDRKDLLSAGSGENTGKDENYANMNSCKYKFDKCHAQF